MGKLMALEFSACIEYIFAGSAVHCGMSEGANRRNYDGILEAFNNQSRMTTLNTCPTA